MAKLRFASMSIHVIGVLIGAGLLAAVSGFVGVLVTQWLTGRRERQGRVHAKLLKLMDKRYELYMDYIDTLSKNHEIFTGSGRSDLDPDEVLNKLVPLEQQMRVFASSNVLSALDLYRDHLRAWSALGDPDEASREQAVRMESALLALALASFREDLGVESYESPLSRWRQRRRITRKVKKYLAVNADIYRPGPLQEQRQEDAPDADGEARQ